jgi:hypothetical protein
VPVWKKNCLFGEKVALGGKKLSGEKMAWILLHTTDELTPKPDFSQKIPDFSELNFLETFFVVFKVWGLGFRVEDFY